MAVAEVTRARKPAEVQAEIDQLAAGIEAIEEHERLWSAGARKKRKSALEKELYEVSHGEALARADSKREALDSGEAYVAAQDAFVQKIRELRQAYGDLARAHDRKKLAFRRARSLEVGDLPVEPLALRLRTHTGDRDRDLSRLFSDLNLIASSEY